MREIMSKKAGASSAFTVLELLIVMAIISVVAAISVPSLQRTVRTYRILGDTRGIAQTLTLAKMRAAANFTVEALDWDASTATYSMKYFQKTTAQFVPDTFTPPMNLSSGVSIGTPAGGPSTAVGADDSSGRILFNSRGLPVDSSFNLITASQAFYINNGSDYYAVSVTVTGRIQSWKYINSAWVAQ
jgi:prepilin-type N-terminal cleavage/methylation domain-containing protein